MKLFFGDHYSRCLWLAWLCAGSLLLGGCNSSEFKLTRKKALNGDPKAQLDLGIMYLNGQGTKQSDAEGLKWCRQAADQGLPSAQRSYGLLLREGAAGPRDVVQGRLWLEKAANKGDMVAQTELATMLGLSTPPFDYAEAMKWLIIAEKNGSTNAPAIIKLISAQISPAELSQAREKAAAFGTEK